MGRCENVFGEVPCIERVHYTRDSGRIKGVKPPTHLPEHVQTCEKIFYGIWENIYGINSDCPILMWMRSVKCGVKLVVCYQVIIHNAPGNRQC